MGDSDDDSVDYKKMYWKNCKTSKKVKVYEDGRIRLSVPKKTDLWRKLRFGYTLENAPFYYRRVKGNFMVSVKVSGKFVTIYDQAGILIRDKKDYYVRCGFETFVRAKREAIKRGELRMCASTAVTKEVTDWASMPMDFMQLSDETIARESKECWFAVKRTGNCVEAFFSQDGEDYKQMRVATFTDESVHVGLYGACPEGTGFKVFFEHFDIEEMSDDEDDHHGTADDDHDHDGSGSGYDDDHSDGGGSAGGLGALTHTNHDNNQMFLDDSENSDGPLALRGPSDHDVHDDDDDDDPVRALVAGVNRSKLQSNSNNDSNHNDDSLSSESDGGWDAGDRGDDSSSSASSDP